MPHRAHGPLRNLVACYTATLMLMAPTPGRTATHETPGLRDFRANRSGLAQSPPATWLPENPSESPPPPIPWKEPSLPATVRLARWKNAPERLLLDLQRVFEHREAPLYELLLAPDFVHRLTPGGGIPGQPDSLDRQAELLRVRRLLQGEEALGLFPAESVGLRLTVLDRREDRFWCSLLVHTHLSAVLRGGARVEQDQQAQLILRHLPCEPGRSELVEWVELPAGVQTGAGLPLERGAQGARGVQFDVGTPSPNPCRVFSAIGYTLPERSRLTASLYSVDGRRVALLHEGVAEVGRHVLRLDLSGVAAGIYFLRVEDGTHTRSRRLTVLR